MPTNPLYPSPSPPPKVAEPLAPVPFERRTSKTPWTDNNIPAPPPYDNERNRRKESA